MVKTRFAPSPTGFLHVGGARTALYSWLYAHKSQVHGAVGAKFVLRIEDTDQVRSTAESAAGILNDLLWLGLNWDEGPAVGGAKNEYFQSERLPLYQKYLDELVAKGRAYEAYRVAAAVGGDASGGGEREAAVSVSARHARADSGEAGRRGVGAAV